MQVEPPDSGWLGMSATLLQEPALPAFCLVLLHARQVDYVQLFDNNRELLERAGEHGEWSEWRVVNP
jgi:hypothetical protein